MKHLKSILLIYIVFAAMGCRKSHTDPEKDIQVVNDNFNDGQGTWLIDFVDYPAGKEEEWEIAGRISHLPSPLDTMSKGLMLSGINRSDDLFMFLKNKVSGLKPNHQFKVKLEIGLASNAPSNTPGVGGAAGENVYIKAGVTPVEPIKVLDEEGYYRLNLDKDSQSLSGKDLFYIDHIGNGTSDAIYKGLNRSGEFQGKSDANGVAWIVIGTDSGHESTTTLFYTTVKANISY